MHRQSEPGTYTNAASASFDFQAWFETWQRECLCLRLDPNGIITFVSANSMELLGYQPSELVGRPAVDFLALDHPDHALIQGLTDKAWPLRDQPIERHTARRRDGTLAYFVTQERNIYDESGTLVATERMAYDETARVEAELSVLESEQKYRRLVEGIRGDYFIFTHSPDGEVTYASPSIKDVLGYDPEMVVGRNWRDFVKADNLGRDEAEKVEGDVAAGKPFHKLVVEIDNPEGEKLIVEVQERQLYDSVGNYESMEGIARDITELTTTTNELQQLRDELEERVATRTAELQATNIQLSESEERYRDLVEKQAEFIVHWTPDLKRTFVNEAYARYIGKPASELVNCSFMPILVKEDLAVFETAMAQLTPENNSVTYEHRIHREGGVVSWAQWTDRAFFDEQGNPESYLSVGRDVTALKEAEDKVRQKELLLEHVSRRAIMGELVAGIAHEIHQPLHAASAFAEAARRHLEMGKPGGVETSVDCMREISEAVTRTATIIRRLRDFTKPSDVKLEKLYVNDLVRESLEILAFETRRAHLYPEMLLASDLPWVQGDRIQLQQIIVSLITNACEAVADVPVQQRKLTIRSGVDGKMIRIEFEDSGTGISADALESVFDAFVTSRSGGTGMGLTVSRTIAEAHRGILYAKSNAPAPGACFVLELPYPGARAASQSVASGPAELNEDRKSE